MAYSAPADVSISDDYYDHKARNSKEPGTDYETPYGTDIRMADNGYISYIDNSNSGAEGRRLRIQLDNGQVVDYIHLSRIYGHINQRVEHGQRGIALSGASGYDNDWYYGAHVHVTLRPDKYAPYTSSIDFEPYTRATEVEKEEEEEPMFIANVKGSWFLVVPQGSNKPRAVVLGADSGADNSGIPVLTFNWEDSINQLKNAVDGI